MHTSNRLLVLWLALVLPCVFAARGQAHPLGNNSVTHFSVLYFYRDRLEIDYMLDIAETPAVTIRHEEIDTNKDDVDAPEEQKAWLERKAAAIRSQLVVELDGKPLPLELIENAPVDPASTQPAEPPTRLVMKIPGFAGMPTYRLLIRYKAMFPPLSPDKRYTLTYEDKTYVLDRREMGLKRVILDHTDEVVVHEKDREWWGEGPDPFVYDLYDPANMPAERTARVVFSPVPQATVAEAAPEKPSTGAPAVAQEKKPESAAPSVARPSEQQRATWQSFLDPRNNPNRQQKYRTWAENVSQYFTPQMSFGALALITALCFGYGALHALAPGHAKTIVAAYLISLRGTYFHAVLLAIIVTLTHAALVVVVGLVFLELSPQSGSSLQLWLGIAAGVIIASMGGWLLFRSLTGRLLHHHDHALDTPHTWRQWLGMLFTHSHPDVPEAHHHHHDHDHVHDHAHDHDHAHTHDHVHPHEHDHGLTSTTGPTLTVPLILWLGISGGIVPCPAATWMMLAGIGQGRPAAGLYAVGVFSIGLALTLMAVGFAALSSRRVAQRFMGEENTQRWLLQVLPAVGGTAVFALGGALTAHYIYALLGYGVLIPWFG